MAETPLRITIIGSGLAGLTAARILREHHTVVVYESGRRDIATGGQGIMISPSGIKILETIGYDHVRATAVPIYGYRTYNYEGKVLDDARVDFKARFGADDVTLKRSDFREELLRLATAPSAELGIAGEPTKIVFHNAVTGLDPYEGIVTLSDGSKVGADVVVVADGIHSRSRDIIAGPGYAARKTGLTCYRLAVATEDAKKALGDLPLPHWWDPSTCENRCSIIYGKGPSFITAYPIRNSTMFNLSCIIKTQDSAKSTTESWNADGDRNKMVEIFSDMGESVRRILSVATEVKVWEFQELESLPTWTRGRAILIGDAAHAMTPMHGQGANMSIEDAESLRLLAPGTRREDVPEILKLAESLRMPRVAHVVAETQKSQGDLSVVDRILKNLDFNASYNGIMEALNAKREEANA